jgi:hypothetical protein
MRSLATAIALATVVASPMYAKTLQPHHPAAAVNRLAPNSPYVGAEVGAFGSRRPTSRFDAPLDDFQSNWEASY